MNTFPSWEPVLCAPSRTELAQMSREEIAVVKGFRVWNQHGSVQFVDPVDLRQPHQRLRHLPDYSNRPALY
jgi:hypothetical protein